MSGRGVTLRLGDFLIRCGARHLPAEMRDDWFRTFAGELPAILGDRTQSAFGRHARMLLWAADSVRGAWRVRTVPASASGARVFPVVRAVSIAAAASIGSAAVLVVAAITADIRLALILSAVVLGPLALISTVLSARAVVATVRRAASRGNAPRGGS